MRSYLNMVFQGILLLSIPFLTLPAQGFSQDSIQKKQKTKIRIEKEENGKTTVFDTTFDSNMDAAMDQVDKIMKENDLRMEDLNDQMKKFEVYISRFDSSMQDSSMNIARNFIFRGDRDNHFRIPQHPQGFNYDFDIEIPELPELPDPGQFEYSIPAPPEMSHGGMFRQRGESLSDVLGDIPMSHVKSYKVKETRNGKRITIDLDEDAVMGGQNKVIIINRQHRPDHPVRPDRPGRPAPPQRPDNPGKVKIEKEEKEIHQD
ncbi:MAG: hypothetical protein ACM3N9_02660 [Syntrophothermus sp.]